MGWGEFFKRMFTGELHPSSYVILGVMTTSAVVSFIILFRDSRKQSKINIVKAFQMSEETMEKMMPKEKCIPNYEIPQEQLMSNFDRMLTAFDEKAR